MARDRFALGFLLSALVASGVASLAGAQGDVFISSQGTIASPTIYRFTEDGQSVRTLYVPAPGWAAHWFKPDLNNRGFICAGSSINGDGVVFEMDRNGVITSVVYLPGTMPNAVWPSSDGDWLVETAGASHRLTPGGLVPIAQFGNSFGYARGRDEETGEWIMKARIGQTHAMYRVDPFTGAVSTFWSRPGYQVWESGSTEYPYDAATGGFLEVENQTASPYLGIRTQGSAMTSLWSAGAITGSFDLVARARGGRRAAYHVVARLVSTIPNLVLTARIAADGTELGRNTLPSFVVSSVSQVAVEGSRHLSWHMVTPPNGRRMLISAPSRPGAAYTAAFSLTGVRPGIPIGSRTVPLVPDTLTALCLAGGIPGVIQNTVGVLDANGEANVTFDTNAFGPALAGIRAWGGAVVFDPQSPNGVSHVLGPLLLRITQ